MAVEFVERNESDAIQIIKGGMDIGSILYFMKKRHVSIVAFLSADEWKEIADKLEELERESDATKPAFPQIGEKWRLKNNSGRVATITKVTRDTGCFGGRVEADAPWTAIGTVAKSMDVWLKYYELEEA